MAEEVHWMTYRELQAALDLPSARAALHRSRRAGWPRRQHNEDKQVRVAVPVAELAKSRNPSREASRDSFDAVTGLRRAGPRRVAGDDPGSVSPGSMSDPQILGALTDALRQERERREAMTEALQHAAESIAWAQGEVAGLREAVRLAEDSARRADDDAVEARQREAAAMARVEQAQAENVALRDAYQQAEGRAQRVPPLEADVAALRDELVREAARAEAAREVLQAERDTAHHRAAEAVTVMGRLVEPLEAVQRQAAEAARHVAEADQRVAAAEAGRQEAEVRLAELAGQAKAADEGNASPAELEAAVTRAQEAEERAAEATRQAEEADQRAAEASARLRHLQIAEDYRAAIQAETVPLWRRVFGRRGRS